MPKVQMTASSILLWDMYHFVMPRLCFYCVMCHAKEVAHAFSHHLLIFEVNVPLHLVSITFVCSHFLSSSSSCNIFNSRSIIPLFVRHLWHKPWLGWAWTHNFQIWSLVLYRLNNGWKVNLTFSEQFWKFSVTYFMAA